MARTGDVALGVKRIECLQQVQVEAGYIHRMMIEHLGQRQTIDL
jgi:hypothetical protein